MSSLQSPSKLFEELAQLFSTAPSASQILDFKPSADTLKRASELLELNRQNQLTNDLVDELNQFEQAELLMRLVKARIRTGQQEENRE